MADQHSVPVSVRLRPEDVRRVDELAKADRRKRGDWLRLAILDVLDGKLVPKVDGKSKR